MASAKVTAPSLRAMKEQGKPIVMLTAYDYRTAYLQDEAGVDVILVGDSVGNAVMGLPDTLGVTMEHMLHHVAMVTRGAARALVVADMPFMSYHVSPEQAATNAGRFVQEAGAQSVKLEGGAEQFGEHIAAILRCGIPVMGHLGLTPQSVHQIGGYKVQGRGDEAASMLIEQARGLEEAGAFAVVLECVPASVAGKITGELNIPTIGIGAGAACDGQVLVSTDLLGLTWERDLHFAKKYADLQTVMKEAFRQFAEDVREDRFPTDEHAFK